MMTTKTTKTGASSAQKKTGTPSAQKKATKTPTVATTGKPSPKASKEATPTKSATGGKQGQPKGKAENASPGKDKGNGMSGIDAAAKVLAGSKEPMGVREIVEVAMTKGYWNPAGKTPWATVYSAIIREIAAKKNDSRFKKTGRGKFAIR